ncbi:MAG: hypothetical protein NXI28_19875 [bacterium]|nr:hypothetical protein [bacterium]
MNTLEQWIGSGPDSPDRLDAALAAEGIAQAETLSTNCPTLELWVSEQRQAVQAAKRPAPPSVLLTWVPVDQLLAWPLSDHLALAEFYGNAEHRRHHELEDYVAHKRSERLAVLSEEYRRLNFHPDDCTLEDYLKAFAPRDYLEARRWAAKLEQLPTEKLECFDQLATESDAPALHGFVVAEVGDFKDGRGHFDEQSLLRIVQLANRLPKGLKSHLGHATPFSDGVTNFLGRATNFRLSDAGKKVRADLVFAASSLDEPVGGGKPIGRFVIDRVHEDSDAIGASLVLRSKKSPRFGPSGESLPDLWTPAFLRAVDIVSEGNAVHSDIVGPAA